MMQVLLLSTDSAGHSVGPEPRELERHSEWVRVGVSQRELEGL